MQSKFFKRILSTVMALSLVVPMGITAKADPAGSAETDNSKYIQERAENNLDKLEDRKADVTLSDEDPNEEVRVIVELKTTPNQVSLAKNGTSTLSAINAEQNKFLAAAARTGMDLEPLKTFKEVFNGTSAVVQRKEIPLLEKIDVVKNVYIAQEYEKPEPTMSESVGVIEAPFAWDLDYKGEGYVVGVIDSGFDPTHPDFILTHPELARIQKNSLVSKDLPGSYINAKFPYAYNYYDQNNIIFESGSSHGQHVAGTVGANGETIKGVAPEVQILGLRVFSNDPLLATTFDDIYIEAMDDAVKIGVDALNLSLGSPAGFSTFGEGAVDIAVKNAREAGVVVAMSAGNEHNMVDGWTSSAADWMPDQGVVGTPGSTPESISVASTEKFPRLYSEQFVQYLVDGVAQKGVITPAAGSPDPVGTLGEETLSFVDGGYGSAAALANAEGKVALVSRGGDTPNFTDKLANAMAAGATALIIYDNRVGPPVNMAGGDVATIPYVFADQATGLGILGLPEGERVLSFGRTPIENPSTQISDFSSWGATPDLRLKPEIAAPGSEITSLQNGGTYGVMSGTSMASPHVAGASALIKNYMDDTDRFGDLPAGDKAFQAKVLLMNSASVMFNDEIARSPRAQGAGMMNLKNAVETTTLAYNLTTGEAKLELKEVTGKSLDLNLRVENFGDASKNYEADIILLTDDIEDGKYTEYSRNVEFTVSGDETFTLAAGETEDISFNVDFSSDDIGTEQFIEGFVVLTAEDGTTTTVPFMGFYGDWNEPYVLDNMYLANGQDPYGETFFDYSSLLYQRSGGLYYQDFSNGRLELNPGNSISSSTGLNNIVPYLSFIRNAENFEVNILNEDGSQLFRVGSAEFIRKVYRLGSNSPVRFVYEGIWEGNFTDGPAQDGIYFYEMKSTINYEEAVPQSKRIPLLIDNTAPTVRNARIVEEDGKFMLYFDATDGSADRSVGAWFFEISNSLQANPTDIEVEADESGSYKVDVTSIQQNGGFELYIFAYDNLLNGGLTTVDYFTAEEELPTIVLTEPWDYSPTTTVDVFGAILGVNHLDKVVLTTGGTSTDYYPEFVENGPVYDQEGSVIYNGPHWVIDTTIEMEVGYTGLQVRAIAKDGTENSIRRFIYVDNGPPELTVNLRERDAASDKAVFDITMFDALPYLRLLRNGEEIFLFNGDGETNVEKTLVHEVDLRMGENVFTFTLIDFLDNVTEVTVTVVRGESDAATRRIAGANRFLTSIELSKEAFEESRNIIIASGVSEIDSLLAGPLAVQLGAPILLVDQGLTNELTAEIRRLGADNAYIIGGEGVVNQRTADDIQAMGLNVTRYGGPTRIDTAKIVDEAVRNLSGVTDLAIIVNGYSMVDALPMGVPAGNLGVGILLNNGKAVDMIADSLTGVTDAYILGGTLVQAEAVVSTLEEMDISTERIAGSNRFATAIAIAELFYDEPDTVLVANGYKSYDALAGTPLSARLGAPILLTGKDELSPATADYIEALQPDEAVILGGPLAISVDVQTAIDNLID